MRIDAHQHFWRIERGDYGWLGPDLPQLWRDFTPGDLAPLLAAEDIDGTVLVQAAPTLAETRFLLGIAASTDFVRGVVGWVDFAGPDAAQQINALAGDPWLVGLRPMIQDIADDDWMLRPELGPAFEALIARDLTFDALVLPRHLTNLSRLLDRHPAMRVVIDHAAKPEVAEGAFDDWALGMARLAGETGAFVKLSGLVTEAAPDWQPADLAPYVDHLLAVFGPERVIWGSDWPVCLLASCYARWAETALALLGDAATHAPAIFGLNAIRAYRLAE
ncbi:hypothetical protein LCGC14_2973410 [marine sediment metagenome]|uniref:Amidohydrolase-related domain-containing protein n=1 Tax=marine sediment metagenome TaxID=412755 RepID=A0A0F8ZGE6_9ZZZZ